MAIRLWHDGTLTRFIVANMPKVPSETGWMLRRDAALPEGAADAGAGEANAATPLQSFIEPLPLPPPQAEASEEGDEGAVDEEG